MRLVFTLLVGAYASALAFGQAAPQVLNYQGKLVKTNGVAYPNGTVQVRVKVMSSPVAGATLWNSGLRSVQVQGGVFSMALQGGTPTMARSVFSQGLTWFEISVVDGQSTERALVPRQMVSAAPWAFWAETVSDGAVTTAKLADDGVTNTKLASDPASLQKVSAGTIKNDAGGIISYVNGFRVFSAVPGVQVSIINGTPDGHTYSLISHGTGSNIAPGSFTLYDATNFGYPITVGPTGNVGVNLVSPSTKLDVNGTIQGQAQGSPGVRGISPNSLTGGVHGSGGYYGVYGDGGQYGVGGSSVSNNFGTGVYGEALASSGTTRGGDFRSYSPGGSGVYAFNGTTGSGLTAISTGGNAGDFSGDVYITNGVLKVNGEAYKPGGGSWANLSDARLKKDIQPLTSALQTMLGLRGVSFEYLDPSAIHERPGKQFGFVAQDVERRFPDWVTTGKDGFKSVSVPTGFSALTVEALRELQLENERLKDTVRKLKDRIDAESAINARLASRIAQIERLLDSNR